MNSLNEMVDFLGKEIDRVQSVIDMINAELCNWDIDKAIRETKVQSLLLHMGYKPSEVLSIMKEMEE